VRRFLLEILESLLGGSARQSERSIAAGRGLSRRPVKWLSHLRLPTLLSLATSTVALGAGGQEVPLFSTRQAAEGETVYRANCAPCHGDHLQGKTAIALAGPDFADAWSAADRAGDWGENQRTVEDLDFIIRSTMPKGRPGRLKAEDYSSVLAYILRENGYVPGSTPLRAGSTALKQARLHFGASSEFKGAPPPQRITGEASAIPRNSGPTQKELNAGATSTRNWLYVNHDYSGARYVELDQINTSNAGQLRPMCVFQVGEDSSFQTGPIIYEGTMYVTTSRVTVALDATNCHPKWRHTWVLRAREVNRNNRGVALKDGYLVRGTPDGYLVALNSETGRLVWAVRAADSSLGEAFVMPPLIYQDLILIGPAGSENAISGWVGAFRLSDGSPVWRFQTVPGATAAGSPSWGNPKQIKLGGGSVWTPFSLDPTTGELIVPVTNPAPGLTAYLRPGDNRYTNSAVVLDVHTGRLLWYKQMVPNDSHDWDLTQVSPLFSAELAGHRHRLLTTVGKDGILRTVDRDSHEIIYARPVTTIKNADAPVTPEGVVACPGVLGGVQWNGPALSRALNMLYVNAVDWCDKITADSEVRFIPGRDYQGGTYEMLPDSHGWLTALDASTGAIRWRYRSKEPLVAAITVTKGNLVLTGELSGDFLVLDAHDGTELYRFNTGGPIGGGLATYEEAGIQYVAVMSGTASANLQIENGGAPTVLVFGLR
jgi:alcohol dehydrogenase (cytochrome c)